MAELTEEQEAQVIEELKVAYEGIKRIAQKVDRIADKFDGIADKIEGISETFDHRSARLRERVQSMSGIIG